MVSNVYTKKEILETLASKGHFIDIYTLDSFFEQWQIEAIFEDEQGQEFFDKTTLDFVCEKLFGNDKKPAQSGVNPNEFNGGSVKENYPIPPNSNNIGGYNQQAIQPQPINQAATPQMQPQINAQMQSQIQSQIIQPQPVNPQSIIQPNMQMQQPYMPYGPYPNAQYQNMQMQQPYMPYGPYPNAQYQNMQMQGMNPRPQPNTQKNIQQNVQQKSWQQPPAPKQDLSNEFSFNDGETSEVLNAISLSNGTSIIENLTKETGLNDYTPKDEVVEKEKKPTPPRPVKKDTPKRLLPKNGFEEKQSLLAGAIEQAGLKEEDIISEPTPVNSSAEDTPDFDDISLLSESFEAQEKFRQYVVSELSKKNVDLTPQSNEFKLDISEKTINMIARTVARKIAKNVTAILTAETKNSSFAGPLKQENEKLVQKTKELEEENRKLRLLLTESNKNLNSFKPSIFGLWKKVKPKPEPKPKQKK